MTTTTFPVIKGSIAASCYRVGGKVRANLKGVTGRDYLDMVIRSISVLTEVAYDNVDLEYDEGDLPASVTLEACNLAAFQCVCDCCEVREVREIVGPSMDLIPENYFIGPVVGTLALDKIILFSQEPAAGYAMPFVIRVGAEGDIVARGAIPKGTNFHTIERAFFTPLFASGRIERNSTLYIELVPPDTYVSSPWRQLSVALVGRYLPAGDGDVPWSDQSESLQAEPHLPDLWQWTLDKFVDPVKGSGGTELGTSYGSGIAYWPERDSLLLLDNGPTRIVELTTSGTYVRTITLSGFADTEAICLVDATTNKFAVTEEGLGTIVEIIIPTSGSPTITKGTGASGWVRTITTGLVMESGAGLESLTFDAANSRYLFATEGQNPSEEWAVWEVPFDLSTVPNVAFNVHSLMAGLGDIADMQITKHGTLLMVSEQGSSPSDTQAQLIEATLDGRLIQHCNVPKTLQAEGITLDPLNERLWITGEVGAGTGVQLFRYTKPI